MSENEDLIEQTNEKKKKGRKPTTKKYFDEPEENAVKLYLISDSSEVKNKIYNEFLRDPLDKMISSIIRRYKLYRKDMDFEEIHMDTHSFLMTKIDKFKPSKEKKAYSYFGTICKNYLMGQIQKDQKETNRKISYEDISSDIDNMPNMVYYIDGEDVTTEQLIHKFLDELKYNIDDKTISEQEQKLGSALYDIFSNYSTIFQDTSNNNKFNKNIILFELREMTNLSTKEIRNSLKRYKKLYTKIVNEINK
jgi:hypothetical protein